MAKISVFVLFAAKSELNSTFSMAFLDRISELELHHPSSNLGRSERSVSFTLIVGLLMISNEFPSYRWMSAAVAHATSLAASKRHE